VLARRAGRLNMGPRSLGLDGWADADAGDADDGGEDGHARSSASDISWRYRRRERIPFHYHPFFHLRLDFSSLAATFSTPPRAAGRRSEILHGSSALLKASTPPPARPWWPPEGGKGAFLPYACPRAKLGRGLAGPAHSTLAGFVSAAGIDFR